MYTKQEIILQSYRLGKSQRQISRDLNINRKTVKRYIEEYERLQQDDDSSHPPGLLSASLITPPRYPERPSIKRRLTQEIAQVIDDHLKDNESKRSTGLQKQTLKGIDILESLHSQGFEIGYTSVCNYIRSKSNKSTGKEVFIRQLYQPGSVCEFDWGEFKLEINGVLGRYYLVDP